MVLFCLFANIICSVAQLKLLSYNLGVLFLGVKCALFMSGVRNFDDGEGHYIFTVTSAGHNDIAKIADVQIQNFNFYLIDFFYTGSCSFNGQFTYLSHQYSHY